MTELLRVQAAIKGFIAHKGAQIQGELEFNFDRKGRSLIKTDLFLISLSARDSDDHRRLQQFREARSQARRANLGGQSRTGSPSGLIYYIFPGPSSQAVRDEAERGEWVCSYANFITDFTKYIKMPRYELVDPERVDGILKELHIESTGSLKPKRLDDGPSIIWADKEIVVDDVLRAVIEDDISGHKINYYLVISPTT